MYASVLSGVSPHRFRKPLLASIIMKYCLLVDFANHRMEGTHFSLTNPLAILKKKEPSL